MRALGPAGPGQHWHHLVEQTPANIARFGPQSVHNTQTVVRLDAGVHRQISGFYSSIRLWTGGLGNDGASGDRAADNRDRKSQGEQECTRDGSQESIVDALPDLDIELPSLPEGFVDFSAGLGDALLFGAGDPMRDFLGIDGGVDPGSGSYRAGAWTSFGVGASRLSYAAAAKGYSIIAPPGAAASAFRASLRSAAKFGMAKSWRAPNLAKYGTDAELRAAAGRTNPYVNAAAAGVTAAGAYGGLGAGCN